ncbi:hypothetical protein BDV06DRAFT_163221 [Aspergillus oleicola]
MPPSKAHLRATPRQNARSQFASTPRFLLSQSQRPVATQRNDSISSEEDVLDSFSSQRPAPTPARDSASRSRRKEVIEDSESELDLEQDFYHAQNHGPDNRANNEIPSSPPPDVAEMDAEVEDLFGPTNHHRAKRRRVSASASFDPDSGIATATPGPSKQRRKPHDFIETSSPQASPFPADSNTPSPSVPYRSIPKKQKQKVAEETPKPYPPSPTPATPATGPNKPSIRNYPRFLPPSSTSHPPPKPTFVLPRSPSPDQPDDPTIPTPFSPSSHALCRRGRQRSSAPSYLPSGMASEVRTWILEMGAMREQQVHARIAPNPQSGLQGRTQSDSDAGLSTCTRVLRIQNVRQFALGSCGPLAFLQGQAIETESGNGDMTSNPNPLSADDEPNARNVLLMGAPRLRPGELRPSSRVAKLRVGDVVGVLRGLVWEVGLQHSDDTALEKVISEHEQMLQGESESGGGRWLVGMEWEVLSGSDA